jgi:acyl-CoA reductase-like NAD-dependent aldehyde dehydrogenase
MTATSSTDALFIGGSWVAPADGGAIEVISPFTEEVIAHAPAASPADVDTAVAAARRAFDSGPWPRMPLPGRIEVLKRVSAALAERRETMALLISDEMGCPITQALALQTDVARTILDTYTELAADYPFRTVRRSGGGNALVTREPVGVVGAIVPWNVPQAVTMHKLAPALLAGCTVVLKPAPETPLDALLLADALCVGGIPEGVVNVVPADREVSAHLVVHSGIDKIAFTGSTEAGRQIASACGRSLKRFTLELGGKSAAIILDDADLDATVESLRMGSFRNSGQVCTLKTRLVVSRRREGELLERLAELVATMPIGDPRDPATQIGPMVSARQRDRVESYIAIGREEGARVVAGGGRPQHLDRGWFVEPTVFGSVDPDSRLAQEEIFGPVVAVIPYEREENAIAIANNSEYGLAGSVFTADLDRGLAVAQQIRTGTVEINASPTGWHAPYGGFKQSGIGREAGPEGFDGYVETRSLGLPAELADRLS